MDYMAQSCLFISSYNTNGYNYWAKNSTLCWRACWRL